jgi:hypothetical protein
MPAAGARRCDSCGDVRYGRLVLRCVGSEGALVANLDTEVGAGLLRTLSADDARFASSPQFTLMRDAELGSWAIRANESAVNPTFLNGAAVAGGPAAIRDGDVISIGPERMKLTVHIED